MSKAEDRALEAYPVLFSERNGYDNTFKDRRESYVKGYHQAEKDLELTWEDMMIIHKCCKDAMNNHLYEWSTTDGQQKIYEEVLKRFKEKKGE